MGNYIRQPPNNFSCAISSKIRIAHGFKYDVWHYICVSRNDALPEGVGRLWRSYMSAKGRG